MNAKVSLASLVSQFAASSPLHEGQKSPTERNVADGTGSWSFQIVINVSLKQQ